LKQRATYISRIPDYGVKKYAPTAPRLAGLLFTDLNSVFTGLRRFLFQRAVGEIKPKIVALSLRDARPLSELVIAGILL
jgi:hypothetical protein